MFLKIVLAAVLLVGNASASPSVWVYDTAHKHVVHSNQSQTVRSIASITKLMSAMVVLDSNQSLNDQLKLTSRLSALPKQLYTRGDLLVAMLIKSDNGAAETLADNYPGGRSVFVRTMNFKAYQLGLHNTKFQDSSGLGIGNISTAEEVGQLILNAFDYEFIRANGNKTEATLHYEHKRQTRAVGVNNTSQTVLKEYRDILVSKTGYTSMAGWCIAFITNRQYIVVVLGEPSKVKRMQQVNRLMHTITNTTPGHHGVADLAYSN